MFLIVQAEHVQFGQKQQQKTRYVAAWNVYFLVRLK
jgi:hypothetical protein